MAEEDSELVLEGCELERDLTGSGRARVARRGSAIAGAVQRLEEARIEER